MGERLSLDGDAWHILGLIPGQWRWQHVGRAGADPTSITGRLEATVPGHVVADVAAAGLVPDPYVGLQSLQAEWISSRDWVYRRAFTVPPGFRRRSVWLHFEGVDDVCTVFLNGHELGSNSGMNRPFEFDVSDRLVDGENSLTVVVEHASHEPETQPQLGSTRAVRNWKARFAYWWDFSTRLVSVGIWDSVWLEARAEAWLAHSWTRPARDGDGWRLDVLTTVRGDASGLELEVELVDGEKVIARAAGPASRGELSLVPPGVRRWDVNGEGMQPLYRAVLRLRRGDQLLDEARLPVAFRTIEFERTPGAGEDALPYRIVVNGRPIFIRGWNWVPVDQLYGVFRPERYRNLIAHARAAGCNLLRVWGGGHLERELFYDLCDEAGILVWQEFIQSSSGIDSEPASDPEYLAYIEEQAEAMVRRRRQHPSLAIWCGGNELASHPVPKERIPLSAADPAIGLLRDVVARLDPDRGFLDTSPTGPQFMAAGRSGHDVHGPWNYLGDGEHERFHDACAPMLYSEFGAEGAADPDAVGPYLTTPWPPDRSNPEWVHHGGYWWTDIKPSLEKLFGPISSVQDYARASQWVQAHALGYAVEAQRRREQETAGVIPWQLNEPWPNGACTNVVEYGGRAKPAYWAVARAYAAAVVNASYRSIGWKAGECFTATFSTAARWRLTELGEGRTLAEGEGLRCEWPVPDEPLLWALDLETDAAWNQYVFSSFPEAPLRPMLVAAPGRLVAHRTGDAVELAAEGAVLFGVRAVAVDGAPGPGVREGWIPALIPGRPRTVEIESNREVRFSAWNES